MTEYKIEIEHWGGWPWPWSWSVTKSGTFFTRVVRLSGITMTEKGARRAAEKAAKKQAVKPTRYTYTVEE